MEDDDDDNDIAPRIHVTEASAVKNPASQCDDLIDNEGVDKNTAIRIYRLYTTMLTQNQQCENQKQYELECLRHEIEKLKISVNYRETLEQHDERLKLIEKRVKDLETQMIEHCGVFDEIRGQLAGIEARLLAATSKKR